MCAISILILFKTSLPDTFEDHFNQAIELIREEKSSLAIAAFEQAAAINPHHAPTYFNMGVIHKSLGNQSKAQECLERAIVLNPAYTKAYSAIASIYASQQRINDAIKAAERTVELGENSNRELFFNLGFWHTMQEEYPSAIQYYKKALSLAPHQKDVLYNLACTLRYYGNFQESRNYYQQVLDQTPTNAHALYGYAECCLALGDYEHGWSAFEARWKRDTDSRHFNEKLWDGSPLTHKTIIIRAEYGQGDTVQFIRYAQLLKQEKARVVVEAQHSLVKLLSYCPYIDQVIEVNNGNQHLPPHDYQVPVMSLPYYFKTRIDSIPATVPYLTVPQDLVNEWGQKLNIPGSYKIGICWDSSPYYEQFKSSYSKKSIPLTVFEPLTKIPGVMIYSLQQMNGMEQLKTLPEGMIVHDFGPHFDREHGRFMDTAAVIQNLDLVITTDTSIAHIAGALGKQVWVLLPTVADWRWMTTITKTPWYPTMTLFRQPEKGRWDMVITQVVREVSDILKKQKKSTSQPISVMTEVQIGELVDKITILQIKEERIKDPAKLTNIRAELSSLIATYEQKVPHLAQLPELWQLLKTINEKLWVIEDAIRDKERAKAFDQEFIELARAVYYTNDERCRIKRDINMLTGSRLMEEKSYAAYA